MVIPDEGERLKSVNDKTNNTKTNGVAEAVEENIEPPEKVEIMAQLEEKRSVGKWLGLDDFPTLHPMVVHLPVVLLPFAFLLLLIEFFSMSKSPQLPSIIATFGGTAGALMASYWLHPHVESISKDALEVLEAHDLFAYITTGFASGASMCLLLRYFRWNSPDRGWWTGSALILLFFSSLSVAATGHLGASLSHVHQVEISKSNH
jgi:Predicted membrane protein